MNESFWDHVVNAAGHLLDARKSAAEQAEADRKARRQARPAKRIKLQPEPTQSFGSDAPPPEAKKPCCVGIRRKMKVGTP